jgi:hypothetical protein
MRHKDNSEKSSQEVPTQVFGSDEKQSGGEQMQEPGLPTRLRFKVGPPETSWSHAKWLALADQALLD